MYVGAFTEYEILAHSVGRAGLSEQSPVQHA